MFVPLTHQVLNDFLAQGYNVLKSPSLFNSESPTYQADTLEGNVDERMKQIKNEKRMHDIHFLPIQRALDVPDGKLKGAVWIDDPE